MPLRFDEPQRKARLVYDKPQSQPVDEKGTAFDALGQGAMLGFSDELAGLLGAIPAAVSTRNWNLAETYRGVRDAARENAAAFRERNPVGSTALEFGGGLLTGGLGAGRLAGLKGAELVGKSGLLGGALGAASGLGYSDAETATEMAADAAKGGALGGVLGIAFPAAGQAVARVKARAVAGATSTPYRKAAKLLEDAGVPLTTAQKTNTNWARAAENTLQDIPYGGKPLQTLFEKQRQAFQKKLFQLTAGKDKINHDMLTRDSLDDLSDILSKQYRKALGNKAIDIADDAFLDDLANIEAKHTRFVDSSTAGKIRQIIDGFLDEASKGPVRDGNWYQAQRSIFRERAKGASKRAGLYRDLKQTLDDAFARTVGRDAKGDLDARYAQYKQLENLYNRVAGGSSGAEGFIPPGQLAREAGKNPGTKEWQEFTRAAATVLPDRLGNSGTAQRQFMLGLLGGGGVAVDPTSALYGPLMARGISSQLASGKAFDIASMLPSGRLLQKAGPLPGALAGPLLLSRD